ncbi:calcium-binding protein, partial [Zavarzinia compransoris]|uniref:calcium-binding protein n=1 Tax=Zavarzinia compransoris TaxID=1264899 RepID=UPI0024418F23
MNPDQIAALKQYLDAATAAYNSHNYTGPNGVSENLVSYYSLQAQAGRGYASLALGVINNSGVAGETANANLQIVAGVAPGSPTYASLMLSLAKSDIAAIDNNNGGWPTQRQVDDYHYEDYTNAGLSPLAWGGAAMAYYGIDWSGGAAEFNDQSQTGNLYQQNLTQAQANSAAQTLLTLGMVYSSVLPGYFNSLADLPPVQTFAMPSFLSVYEAFQLGWAVYVAPSGQVGVRRTPPPGLPGSAPNFSDPLVLDLHGTGIDLSSLSDSSAYFDYGNSGFAVHTGWITAGEGLLVLDNGQNDSAVAPGELLGAVSGDGFQDLAALDSNGDGVINSNDAAFANLKVWVDANVDGQSGNGELYALSDLGITSISASAVQSGRTINGNMVVASTTFTVEDGSSGAISTHTIAEVNFATNRQDSKYSPPAGFCYQQSALRLPELAGYGTLPDLRIAMSLNSTLLSKVQTLVLNADSLSSAEFDTAFQAIVQEWAGAADVDPTSKGPYVDARHMAVIYAFYGIDPSQQPEYDRDPNFHNGPAVWEPRYRAIVDELEVRFASQISVSQLLNGATGAAVQASPYLSFASLQYNPITDRLSIDLDRILQSLKDGAPTNSTDATTYWNKALPIVKDLWVDYGNASALATQFFIAANRVGVPVGAQAKFYQRIGRAFSDNSGITGEISGLPQNAFVVLGDGDKKVVGNIGDFYLYSSDDGNDTIQPVGSNERLMLSGLRPGDVMLRHPATGNDLVIVNNASGASVTITGYFSGHGLDAILFADGTTYSKQDINGVIAVEAGRYLAETTDDLAQKKTALADFGYLSVIDATGFATTFDGTNGNDAFILGVAGKAIKAGTGNDLLASGLGDDSLEGAGGDDTYAYRRGDGNDIIIETSNNGGGDRLVLSGINPTDVSLVRNGNDVTLVIAASAAGAGDGGSILLKAELDDYFDRGVESIVFADGTTWSRAGLRQKLLAQTSTAGNDTVTGFNSADTIIGGHGNDSLNGAAGNDTYLYARGDGNDTITELTNNGSGDKLVLAGVNPTDVSLVRNGNDVTLMIAESAAGAGDGGSILLKAELDDYFDQGVESIVFANGTTWSRADMRVKLLAQASTTGNDTITGFNTADTITGGRGNDSLNGAAGNDTYLYARGDGNDTITEITNNGSGDKLVFFGINPTDVSLVRNGNDVSLMIAESAAGVGDGGSILLKAELDDYFDQGVESVVFANGTTWSRADMRVKLLAQASTTGNDTITGFNTV